MTIEEIRAQHVITIKEEQGRFGTHYSWTCSCGKEKAGFTTSLGILHAGFNHHVTNEIKKSTGSAPRVQPPAEEFKKRLVDARERFENRTVSEEYVPAITLLGDEVLVSMVQAGIAELQRRGIQHL
jgi:hypothetical protein